MTLRFGLIGLGHHGRNAVAPAFYDPQAHAELSAVCDVSQAALDGFTRPVQAKYADHRQMLAGSVLDAVYVAAGMDRHCALVLDCLRAGKHVVVEKPMAATLAECRLMVETARSAGRVLAVNFETRYSEQNDILRRWIAGGHFGRIEALHFTNMWDGHKTFGPIRERRARLMALAGALDCGIHKLDQARFLLGGTWNRVEALGAWLGEPSDPPPHIGILAQLSTGIMVTLNASLAWAANIEPRPMVNTLEIAGTQGVALCRSTPDFRRMTLQLYSATLCQEMTIDSAGHTSDIVLLLKDFHETVGNSGKASGSLASGEDGYWAQFATEQANQSAQRNRIPQQA
jgi:predicted dehydrogenase